MKILITFLVLITGFTSPTFAAGKASGKVRASSTGMLPEALGAKAFLEDVLARRYAAELSTTIDKNSFSVGAQLDLVEIHKDVKKTAAVQQESEPINDLMLGTLDPEDLMKKFAADSDKETAHGFLANYRIRTVNLSVGLKDDLGPDVKTTVEKWLTERLNAEFGKNGKGTVAFITAPIVKKGPALGFWDVLNQFQSLAGQLVMALALLLGVVLWQMLSGKKAASKGDGSTVNIQNQAGAATPGAVDLKTEEKGKAEREANARHSEQIAAYTLRLNDLAPRVSPDMENIVRSWIQLGDPGKLRLACFAEAVGKEVGRLPIPVDALADVTKIFSQMAGLGLAEKKDALEKAYWDLLSVINLGVESLSQPFGYLGGLNVDMVNQVLIDQNPKMKTLVSLFMPTDLRARFLRSMTLENKRDLLETAAKMTEVGVDEMKALDGTLMSRIKPTSAAGTVPLEMTLNKVAAVLNPTEALVLLKDMKGPAIENFKRTVPSLAFLHEWPKEALSILLASATSDEIVAVLRVRADLKDTLLAVCPPMTTEMVTDELNLPDKTNDAAKAEQLNAFTKRLATMLANKDLNLDDIFQQSAAGSPNLELVSDKKVA